MTNSFVYSFKVFVNNFEKEFLKFLRSQCEMYYYAITAEKCEVLGMDILANMIKEDIQIRDESLEIFLNATGQCHLPNFLLNKSLLYVLEHYSIFLRENPKNNFEYLSMCIHHLSKFSYLFEKAIRERTFTVNSKVNFSHDNIIITKNNIVEILSHMRDEKKTVTFMNLYQGMPISHEGKIIDIGDNRVVFKVTNEFQEIAMKLKGAAHIIQNEYLPRHVKADVEYINFYDHTVTLTNFVYLLNMPAVNREFMRIYPDMLAQVSLHGSESEQVRGNLYDLSQNGLGFISNENTGFYVGAQVFVSLLLDEPNKKCKVCKLETKGEIVNIIEYDNSYRYCLKIFPDQENLTRILDYIKKRQKSIIEELKLELQNYKV
ncbi:MAG: PilZ domain-containing protein [Sulfurospirillaceae bacterium]|nr:PilZ domain-containing protein [Sulfurospirillaceae bacterium]